MSKDPRVAAPLCPFCGANARVLRDDGLWASACGEVECTRKARELIAGAYAKKRLRAQAREHSVKTELRPGLPIRPPRNYKNQTESMRIRPIHCYRLLPDVVDRLAAYAASQDETKSAILEALILSLPDVRASSVHSPLAESTPETAPDTPPDTEQK